MSATDEARYDAYLDGALEGAELAAFGAWLREDPRRATELARRALLHDHLRELFRAPAAPEVAMPSAERPRGPRRSRRALLGWAAALLLQALGALALWKVLTEEQASAEQLELEAILAVDAAQVVRSFRITALVAGDPDARSARGRAEAKAPIDGALLHVGAGERYALIRRTGDGEEHVTGCDGRRAWAVPPRGKVRVSRDPQRFRGALPGQQHAIPFLDLGGDLARLREAYALVLYPAASGGEGALARLSAQRKDGARGGPKRVEIWYDPSTKRIERLEMDRLPRGDGGPRALLLERVIGAAPDASVFEHASYHGKERVVVEDDAAKLLEDSPR